MAGTPRLIMAFLFICTLVASNTLMCTARVQFRCYFRDAVSGEYRTREPDIVGRCYTSAACEALCSRLSGQLFETDDEKRGRCSADNDQPGQPMVCACC